MNRRAIAAGTLGVGALLLAVLFGRAFTLPSRQLQAAPVAIEVDAARLAERLGEAVRFPTVSHVPGAGADEGGGADPAPFDALFAWAEAAWPEVWQGREARRVGLGRHLIVPGSDPSAPQVVVLAHVDVVPVEPGTEAAWAHPPFSGAVADGFVWGRGTLDNKHNFVALNQALSALGRGGWRPRRSLHVVFGGDEEVGGPEGAAAVAAALAAQGVAVHAVYDEGLVIGDGLVPGIPGKVGLIGVAEKGYLTLELTATAAGGHSSMPPPGESAVGVLAAAITRLESTPFPADLGGPAGLLFDWAGPHMDLPHRLLFANRWLSGPIVKQVMSSKASSNASLRTTVAPTMLRASVKENVLAQRAVATVNLRLHPRDSVESATAWVRETVGDARVEVAAVGRSTAEPSRVASVDGPAFLAIQRAYAEVFPGLPVAPALFIAQTDSRHFNALTADVYRFQPLPAKSEDLARIHGTNERIAVDDLANVARVWQRLLLHATE